MRAHHDRDVAPGFRRLFEPIRIGNFTVRNRIVNTTHGTALPEARDLRYLQERARGGVGLMGLHGSLGVFSYTLGPAPEAGAPDWDQKPISPTTSQGIAHYDNVAIPYMQRRAEVVHAEGASCFAQVYHLGVAPHAQRMHPAVGPSPIPDPYDAIFPHPVNEAEIEELILAFAHGIRRVRAAGMDAAELHGAHGYLINEFLSPYFNHRTDKWGGSLENRVRFVREIIIAARRLVGEDFPIGIRLGVDGDGQNRGITVSELVAISQLLANEVAYISISGGNYSGFGEGYEKAYVSPWYREPAFNAPAAAAVKATVDVPIIVTGRIADPAIAEGVLADGSADMIGMVRALIADPELPNKTRSGRAGEVRMCLGMSECHYIGPHRSPMTCAVNAAAAREAEMEIRPAANPRVIVVVGAGPAGMEAARVAALRGHTVFLADDKRQIGGTPRILALDDNRRNLRDHAAYFETELKRLGVTLLLGSRVSAEELVQFNPEVVVVATGALPLIPPVDGINEPHVITALQALAGALESSEPVLVVAGLDNHLAGPTLAEFAADRDCQVELISEHVDFAHGAEDGTRMALYDRLAKKHVRVSMAHRLVSTTDRGATVANAFTGEERRLYGYTVILACGLVPDATLAAELEASRIEVHVVGDALAPRRLMHATIEGARVANSI